MGKRGEALFYDGKTVTSLLDPNIYGKNPEWGFRTASFTYPPILSIKANKKRFHVQVNSDLTLTPILMWDDFGYDLTKIGELWVGVNGIYIEKEGRLNALIIEPKHVYLWNFKYLGKAPNEAIAFEVDNIMTNKKSSYFIVRASPTAQCMRALDPSTPIVIGDEKPSYNDNISKAR